MKNISSNPIGIFDSGIGGLTVTHAITKVLPNENIIYFGDTAHLPYGDKSVKTIQARAIAICDFLLSKNCKMILIACNSASAAAYDLVNKQFGSKIKIFNVIDPIIQYVSEKHSDQTVGLIGTWQTVNSNVYQKKLRKLNSSIKLNSLATPLLAPMIEEGFCHNKIAEDTINEYLSNSLLQNIETLILGCTHYPIIRDEIEKFYANKVNIIDTTEVVALAVKKHLKKNNLKNDSKRTLLNCYISDYNDYFILAAERFFGQPVNLEYCSI
jgi:glutamate racemase